MTQCHPWPQRASAVCHDLFCNVSLEILWAEGIWGALNKLTETEHCKPLQRPSESVLHNLIFTRFKFLIFCGCQGWTRKAQKKVCFAVISMCALGKQITAGNMHIKSGLITSLQQEDMPTTKKIKMQSANPYRACSIQCAGLCAQQYVNSSVHCTQISWCFSIIIKPSPRPAQAAIRSCNEHRR